MPYPADQVQTSKALASARPAWWPSLLWALLLHALLLGALLWGWRSHSASKAEDDAAPAQVGLWTAADLAAASRPPPKNPAQAKAEPKALKTKADPLPPEDADIHLGQKKTRKAQPSPKPTVAPTIKPTARPTAKPRPTEKPKATPQPSTDPRLAQAKAEKQRQEKVLEKERQEALKAMLGQAKHAGQAGANTTSAHNGQGKAAYKPSNDYLARIGAIIKRNTHFDANNIVGNPSVKIEIRLSPDGTILGKPRILRSSGQADWDLAAVEGIERAEVLPRDPSLGTAPPVMVIDRKPKD